MQNLSDLVGFHDILSTKAVICKMICTASKRLVNGYSKMHYNEPS